MRATTLSANRIQLIGGPWKWQKNISAVYVHRVSLSITDTHNLWDASASASAALVLNFTRAKLFILKKANKFVKTLISTVEMAIFKSPAQ